MGINKQPLPTNDNKPSDTLLCSDPISQNSSESYDMTSSGIVSKVDDIDLQSEIVHIIDLKPISLTDNDDIDCLNFFPRRNILQIEFNDRKYNGNTIILSTNLAHSDWTRFTNVCRKVLEQKGIEKNDMDSILNSIDCNFDIILDTNSNSILPYGNNKPSSKNLSDTILGVVKERINCKFVDQYNEAFVQVNVNDHLEVMPITNKKFARFVSNIVYESCNGQIVNKETINAMIDTLQAQAEYGRIKYPLSLRVAEYNGDFYYDLTDDTHRCVKISKREGNWQILDKTPIPLFRRYNQTPQEVFPKGLENIEKEELNKKYPFIKDRDPIDEFLSRMTNIKQEDEGTKLLVKVALVSYFIPDIPHPIMILHGSAGSAKSTLQLLIKNIVDPAKPSLLTLHNNSAEFIQQLAHNYLATYDNLKYTPYWLADEVCKAVTGVGQTKRLLYTDDEDKIYEYKHCLIFNGINVAFSEPDLLDRSIVVQLEEIDDEKRKTEKEILNEFYSIRPHLLGFIFETLSKAILIKEKLLLSAKRLPRMADFALWGESILQAWGYKDGEFLKIYYDNMGRQNDEVIDTNPVALAIRKLVEEFLVSHSHSSNIIFEGSPTEFLDELNRIATSHRINTFSKEWPKDVKWLVRRINLVKSNLHKALDVRINTNRDSRNNTSKILLIKNVSDDSGGNGLSPDYNILTPSFDNLYPEKSGLLPEKNKSMNRKLSNSGDIGYTGDISSTKSLDKGIAKNENKDFIAVNDKPREILNEPLNINVNSLDPNILYDNNTKFYSCKQHPNVKNIHYDEIIRHRQLSPDHNDNDSYLNKLRD